MFKKKNPPKTLHSKLLHMKWLQSQLMVAADRLKSVSTEHVFLSPSNFAWWSRQQQMSMTGYTGFHHAWRWTVFIHRGSFCLPCPEKAHSSLAVDSTQAVRGFQGGTFWLVHFQHVAVLFLWFLFPGFFSTCSLQLTIPVKQKRKSFMSS